MTFIYQYFKTQQEVRKHIQLCEGRHLQQAIYTSVIVEEKALRVALENKRLWGAALDVFEVEDARAATGLRELPNVILTPHIASATHQAREEMTRLAVNNLMKALAGERPDNLVND